MLYIVFRKKYARSWEHNKKEEIRPVTYIFKKNKLYDFNNVSGSGGGNNIRFVDEIGNVIDDYNDIWYDPFVFVYEKDLEQVERYLKIRELNGIT